MPFDPERIIRAALEAALEEPTPPERGRRPRLSTGRAVLIGAGAVTAARLAIRMRGDRLVEALQERLLEYDGRTSPPDEELAPEDEGKDVAPAPARPRR